jgi:Short C-terminal domain
MRGLVERALLVVAPLVIVFALTQRWYFAATVDGDVFRTRFPLTHNDELRASLVCCVVYIVVALLLGLRLKWLLAGLSLVLSLVGVALLFDGHGQLDFPNDPEGQTTVWFTVAAVAGVIWVAQSIGLVALAAMTERVSETGVEIRGLRHTLALWTSTFYVPGTSAASSLERSTGLRLRAWLGIASAVAMVIGAFGPWGKALTAFGSVSISGTDGSNDGWLVVGAAVLGTVALVAASRRKSVFLAVFIGLLGVGSAGVCLIDRQEIEGFETDSVLGGAGWGLNLALVASLCLGVFALSLIRRRRPQEAATLPVESVTHEAASRLPRSIGVSTAVGEAKPDASSGSSRLAVELERLADLHARGALTDDEFGNAKRQLLGG